MQTSSVLLSLFSLRGAVVRGMAIATVARVVSLRRLLVLRLDVVSLSLSPYFAVITLVAVRDTKPRAFTAKRLERAEKLEWMGLPRVFSQRPDKCLGFRVPSVQETSKLERP